MSVEDAALGKACNCRSSLERQLALAVVAQDIQNSMKFEKQGSRISGELEQACVEALEPADRPLYAEMRIERRGRRVASGVVVRDGERVSVGCPWPRPRQPQGADPMDRKIPMDVRRRFVEVVQEGRERREVAEFDLYDAPLPIRTFFEQDSRRAGFSEDIGERQVRECAGGTG